MMESLFFFVTLNKIKNMLRKFLINLKFIFFGLKKGGVVTAPPKPKSGVVTAPPKPKGGVVTAPPKPKWEK